MEPQFQTSFIPKKPVVEDRAGQSQPVSVLVFLATIIFFAALVASGIVGFNKASIVRSINDANKQLQAAKDRFEQPTIDKLTLASRRLNASQEVLSNHITIVPVFQAIQDATLKSIQFTRFSDVATNVGGTPNVQIKMTGRADNFEAIAQQSFKLTDKLTDSKYFHDPVFSNFVIDAQKKIIFDLTFSVDPHYVNYGEALARLEASLIPVPTAPTTTPESATTGTTTGSTTGGPAPAPTTNTNSTSGTAGAQN